MAYDQILADRIKRTLTEMSISFTSKDMMGAHTYSMNDKMLCKTHIDKKHGNSLLTVRIGDEAFVRESVKKECLPMDLTGRPMKGFAYITPEGYASDKDLRYWLQLCVDYSPHAPESKKKK